MAKTKSTVSLADIVRGAVGESSIAAMDAAASDSDTSRAQIIYVPLESLVPDDGNFYSLDGIEELAANIETVGLLDPIVVRPVDGTAGRYRIVSGHRRRAALNMIVACGNKDFEQVPVIVKRDAVSPALQELQLIFANSATRKMTDADLAKQAERVEALLYQLKEEGFEFPGRMRDHVAEACNVSATKLATLKVIREKLPEQYQPAFEAGHMTTDAAYKLAKMEPELQARICKAYGKAAPTANQLERLEDERKKRHGCTWTPELTCPDGKPCTHGDAFLRHDAGCYLGETCGGKKCCLTCDQASRDWSPCGSACVQAKKARTEKNAERKKKEETQREKEQAKIRREVQKSLGRLLPLVDAAGLPDKAQLEMRFGGFTVKQMRDYCAGNFGDKHFYSNNFELEYAQGVTLINLAKQLKTTTDFLLELTDDPAPRGAANSTEPDAAPQWRTGTPERSGLYWCKLAIDGNVLCMQAEYVNMDGKWYHHNGANLGADVVAWVPLPDDEEDD